MNNVTINSETIDNLLNRLDNKELKDNLILTALKEGAKVIQQNAIANLRRYVKSNTPNHWNGRTMESGIKIVADRIALETKVHIMGDYRLRFFEKGTKDRLIKKDYYTKNHKLIKAGTNRGKITGKYFFRNAVNNENPVYTAIEQSLTKSLNILDK